MAKKPNPKRGMPRSLIYMLIPGGFILLVVFMVLGGFTAESDEEVETVPVVPEAAAD